MANRIQFKPRNLRSSGVTSFGLELLIKRDFSESQSRAGDGNNREQDNGKGKRAVGIVTEKRHAATPGKAESDSVDEHSGFRCLAG